MADSAGYAPFDIERNTATAETTFGLIGTRVEAGWGSAYVRHLPDRVGEVATVFMHGASGAWTGWTPLLAAARLEGILVPDPVLIDLPGWGDGHLGAHSQRITIDDIASLVLDVLAQLGYERAHLVGHSMGGFIALHLAATSPARVVEVGAVSPTSFAIIRSVEHPFREFLSVPAFTMLWRVMSALGVLGGAGRALVRGATAIGVMRLVFAPLFRHGSRMPASAVLATANDIDARAFLGAAEVVRGYDAHAIWSSIRCPVNALAGDRDVFMGASDLDELRLAVPHSDITVIAECGHFALVEWPVRTLRALGFRHRSDSDDPDAVST